MFAINHAATALVIKKQFPASPMIPLLIAVQFMELVWVLLNYLGIEMTRTNAVVKSVADVHLAHMPFSHSVVSTLVVAALAWLVIARFLRRPMLAVAVGLGILSHIVLDLLTHVPDIALAPMGDQAKLGSGLYALPALAFVAETTYGLACWWIYKGGKALLLTILGFNLANASFFFAAIPGPEGLLADAPMLVVSVVFAQIVITLTLVGLFSRTKVDESRIDATEGLYSAKTRG